MNYSSSYCYYGISEDKNEIIVHSLSNTTNKKYITQYLSIKHISTFYYSNSSLVDILVYKEDTFVRNSLSYEYNKTNFSATTSSRNYIDKVIQIENGGKIYNVVFTILKHVYLITLAPPSTTIYYDL